MTYHEHNVDHWVALFLWIWLAAAAVMSACWGLYRRFRNAGIVDVGWAVSLVAAAVLCLALTPSPRTVVLGTMITLWGVRLALHLVRDRVIGRPEDGRYVALRHAWGPAAERRFFWFFQAQAVLVVVLAAPLVATAVVPHQPIGWLEIVAVALWLCAVAGETLADRQLATFKSRPETRGRTCREGLWRYSRHPNYFFEWLVWVAYALFAVASPGGYWAFVAPAVMLFLLFRVTGIPATEAHALRSRGADYREYQATTSAFLPWWPAAPR
jgi:steroid 5-alpha reductase family enzyme